jgi:flagellar hook-associated protein FlgK
MSLLGEISKSSEALRYHAKTAEIAGQNLAHVNDEDYARQRVLAREGVMYGAFGGLQTSGLEAGGLDHARSRLLDDRVITEGGETAALKAKKEILDLLQAAMGENLTNTSVNAGLDEDHESILAPGSLSRAINDFFNSFHDLSVSPNDATTKQDIYNKIETLVNRFNETGENLDRIESDLTLTVGRSIENVNRLLDQIHEVNKQVRRFELQDKGKAVSYRDRRQALLEELSSYMNFSFEDDVDATTGKVSGFLNLFVDSKDGRKINLLDPTGPKILTNDWDQKLTLGSSLIARDLSIKNNLKADGDATILTPDQITATASQAASRLNPGGRDALVQAKVTSEGKLGRIEVLDGGTLYNDSDSPILLTFLPPQPSVETVGGALPAAPAEGAAVDPNLPVAGQPIDTGNEVSAVTGGATQFENLGSISTNISRKEGDVFYFNNDTTGKLSLWQTLEDTIAGINPNGSDQFMEITDWPNGKVDETKRKFSDLEGFKKGDQIYYEGKYYQASNDAGAVAFQTDEISNRSFAANDVFQYEGKYYQSLSPLVKGIDLTVLQDQNIGETIQVKSKELQGVGGSVLLLGDALPENDPVNFASKTLPLVDGDELLRGDVLNVNNSFFMMINDQVGTLDSANPLHLKYLSNDFNPENSSEFVKINAWIDSSVKQLDKTQAELELQIDEIYNHQGRFFIVNDAPYVADSDAFFIKLSDPESIASFNPFDEQWSEYIYEFNPQLVNPIAEVGSPESLQFLRTGAPTGHNTENGVWKELNLGIAEAVVKGGEIKDFKIINQGNGLPSENAIFLDGSSEGVATELKVNSGAVAGYQGAKLDVDKFRVSLNGLVKDFVSQVNEIYNPTDEPGGYIFGFDAFLTRPVRGPNTFIEETYGLYGKEGNGELNLFEEEVSMTLPYAENDTFTIVQSSNILPKELEQGWDLENSGIAWFRGGNNFGLQIEDVGVQSNFYASARRMQHTTIDYDSTYPGEDKLLTPSSPNSDDGRFWLRGYEDIPFRIEDGSEMYIQGDNFKFDAVLSNDWNLASALRVDDGLNAQNIKSSEDLPEGANDTAFRISKLGDGEFTEIISVINADLGNEMGDLNDNLEHQESIENLLLDQRRAVSSVSIDEEVADLMQFQRSFQASSRVLNTLDKMLELVVMGLVK